MSAQPKPATINVVDAVNARLSKIEAIARLLMDVDPTGMQPDGLSNTAWAIVDFATEAHDLLNGKTEATP